MRILLATSNPHKLEELLSLLPGTAGSEPGPAAPASCAEGAGTVTWLTLNDLAQPPAPPAEDGDTFEANALLKARYYAKATGLITLADDSGLEVDALGGEPGVRSARYAEATGTRREIDVANYQRLLKKLEGVPRARRGARFVCAMAFVDGDAEQVWRGTVEGEILDEPRGENGFGYDPVFYVPALGHTAAEMQPQQKNTISHRGAAARLIWPEIRRRLG